MQASTLLVAICIYADTHTLSFLALNMFEVSTLGQPFEVMKTQMAANRGQSVLGALSSVWQRGGVLGFYQGLIPWAWIEGE